MGFSSFSFFWYGGVFLEGPAVHLLLLFFKCSSSHSTFYFDLYNLCVGFDEILLNQPIFIFWIGYLLTGLELDFLPEKNIYS